MKIAVFDTRTYDREAFEAKNADFGREIAYLEPRLTRETAPLAAGFPVVCAFVHDRLDAPCLEILAGAGLRLVALRSAGYDPVDLSAAAALGLPVVRVPECSPHLPASPERGASTGCEKRASRLPKFPPSFLLKRTPPG